MGAEQKEKEKKNEEKEEEEEEKSCGDGSPRSDEIVVAIAIRTPPLMAL